MGSHHAGTIEDQVQAWVEDHWDESITLREWWRRLASAGYSYPRWPTGVGGSSASAATARTVTAVLARNGVIGPPVGYVAATLAAPTILAHGSERQIRELVWPIASGEASWCQLFSEPGSGSDLASIGASAVQDGDEWVVNGQKVWNSAADRADFGMLLARTDPDRPKHQGITYFVIDMHQPGVEARPLRQMNGTSSFCEVFMTDARVRVDLVLGDLNGGWKTAQTTLASERSSVAGGATPGLQQAQSGSNGDLDLVVGDIVERSRRAAKGRQSVIRSNAVPTKVMLELARQYGMSSEPVTRQDLARYISHVRVNGWTMQRIAAAGGRLTGADGSIAKITTSRVCQMSRDLSYRIVGSAGMLMGTESPLAGELQVANLGSPGTRIGGGTDEIQMNVLGERALGLPREPSSDKDVPYRDLMVGTQR